MNLFDPALYADVRRPLREAQTLPPVCYSSADFYAREVREIFLKKWNLVGRGDLDQYTGSYRLEEMVTVKRTEFLITTNWKSYVENSMESFHHPTVHKDSVNNPSTKKRTVVGDPGHYVLVQSDAGGATRAVLNGASGFPAMSDLTGAAALGAQYLLIYPCTMLGCDVDSMWFKQMVPEGPDKVRNIVAVCFPKETVARDDFDQIVTQYYQRFDTVIAEDNAIAEVQYNGLSSPLARPGRFSHREPLVHVIDNWVLDQVLTPASHS